MRDDFLSAEWAGSHRAFSAGVAAVIETIAVSLARLHAKQFDAPWKRDQARCG